MPHEGRSFAQARSALSPARAAALDVVSAMRVRDAFAHELIDSRLERARLSSEDRAFATLLALGVASTHGTLDEIIDRTLDKPSDLKPDVRDCLRISTYEIIFLKKSPHAAVDQGVELVRSVAPRAAGLANFALRRIVRDRTEFPFGDPATDDAALARLHAFPLWLCQRLIAELGREEAAAFMRVSNEQAPVFVAVNALRPDEALEAALGELGAQETGVAGCLRLPDARLLGDRRIARALGKGALIVSDLSAQRVARLCIEGLTRSPGTHASADSDAPSLLEVGAGRGTKTILLQSDAQRLMGVQIALFPLDNHAYKTELCAKRAATCGVRIERTFVGDGRQLGAVVGERLFDGVFIDAPCSGLGTLRRHPEIRWRLREETIDELARTQQAMLRSAAARVKPGGVLVYSTCTITGAENAGNIKDFLASSEGAGFHLEPIDGHAAFAPRLCSGGQDAHFAVVLRKDA